MRAFLSTDTLPEDFDFSQRNFCLNGINEEDLVESIRVAFLNAASPSVGIDLYSNVGTSVFSNPMTDRTMMPRIVQLTDLHLFCDRARLKNVPTWETLRDVCRHVKTHAGKWDLLVLTGDLAHDELAETYELLREELGDWLPRCRLVPGNHDNRAGLRTVFSDIVPATDEFISFAEDLSGWRILGIDSHQPGEVPGRIKPEQLDWLSRELKQHRDQPTLLFLHHPPIPVNSPWLDKIGLENPEPFQQLIAEHPQIQAIITGHVHHEFRGKLGTADVLTSPSTSLQFEPKGEDSSYTNDPPGYRIFDLEKESYRTEVHRLPELRFPPLKDE